MSAEFELPGVWIDLVDLDETHGDRLRLINLDPEDGETDVLKDTLVALDIVDLDSVGVPDLSATTVHVNGALAFAGGVFYAPYDGAGSSYGNPYPYCLRVTLDYTGEYSSLSTVQVQVFSRTLDLLKVLGTTYTFQIEDLTSPRVDAASAVGQRTVRVSFDEAVKHADATAANDALNSANYSVERLTAPSVVPTAVGVTVVDDSTMDVLFDAELTQNAGYRIVVENVEDVWDNVVPPPYNFADFVGYAPEVPLDRRWDLWKLLPLMNRQEDETEDLEKFVRCLQEVSDLLLCDIDKWTDILDPDRAAEQYLDLMLLDLGNPFSFDLSEIDKRRLLNLLVAIYQQKGTERGIENVIRFFLGLEVEVVSFLSEETWVLGESELVGDSAQSGTDGKVSSPRNFFSATASFTAMSVGGKLRLSGSLVGNDGEYEIAQYLNANEVLLVEGTELLDEGPGLTWTELGNPVVLGPGDSWGRRAFEIVSEVVLTDEQRKRVEQIAEYMKPAGTHLLRIVEPTTPPVYEHVELGISELGGDEWWLH